MKVAILAGGLGSRMQEYTDLKPKPMIEIGGQPVLWHIMKIYGSFGFRDFVLALGYRQEVIKRWMVEYHHLQSDLTVSMGDGRLSVHEHGFRDEWTVNLVDTGQRTQTGGRVKRLAPHLGDETFMLTYGDGVSDLDLDRLLEFHRSHGKLATLTAVRPPARFGHLELDGSVVSEFSEKLQTEEGWINGGFYVLEPAVLEYVERDQTAWERQPLERLAKDGQLMAYRHESFWQCMDNAKEMNFLEGLWESGQAPWKLWD